MGEIASRLLWNRTTNQRLASVSPGPRWMAVAIGWIGRCPDPGVAMKLAPCSRVHTFGVPCPIDVVHCDRHGSVLAVDTLAPNRIGPRIERAQHVWESAQGSLIDRVAVGDRLEVRDGS